MARFIAREQTVEIPQALVEQLGIPETVLGAVDGIEAAGERFRVAISYGVELAAGQLPQLLNLLYGIVSLDPRVRLDDFELPPSLLKGFPGPSFGVEGVRSLSGQMLERLLIVGDRPRRTDEPRRGRVSRAAGLHRDGPRRAPRAGGV